MRYVLALLPFLSLVACTQKADPVTPCMFEVDPPGSYAYPLGVENPVITPAEGGTQAGADALMACVAARTGSAPGVSGASRGIAEETALPGGESGVIVKRYTYGTPTSSSTARQSVEAEMSAVPFAADGQGQ